MPYVHYLNRRQLIERATIAVISGLGTAGLLGCFSPRAAHATESANQEFNHEYRSFADLDIRDQQMILSDQYTNEDLINGGVVVLASIDGYWGKETSRMLQIHYGQFFGIGGVDHQWPENVAANSALTSGWNCDRTGIGDSMIRSLQRDLGTPVDGILGTVDILALQARCGTYQDGVLTGPSPCVMEMQRRLNAGAW